MQVNEHSLVINLEYDLIQGFDYVIFLASYGSSFQLLAVANTTDNYVANFILVSTIRLFITFRSSLDISAPRLSECSNFNFL
jgi:hypothetical protein